jgi:hypothetical protein
MMEYARKVGRLVEIRVRGAPDIKSIGRTIALANELGPDAKVVVCNDWRQGDVVPGVQVEKLITLIRSHSQRAEAGVLVVGEKLHEVLFGERVKRSFSHIEIARSVDEALVFLKPHLNAAELARAKQFLDEK